LAVDKDDRRIGRLLEEVKAREARGYAYEAADASFELLARRMLGRVPDYFDVTRFDVTVEQRINAKNDRVTVTMAGVKVKVGGGGQRPGERARSGAAQGPRQISALYRGPQAHRLSRAYPRWRHRGGDAGVDRKRGRARGALDHGRGVAEHHRGLVPGVNGLDR